MRLVFRASRHNIIDITRKLFEPIPNFEGYALMLI